jgi:hypothetical protein
MKGKFLANYENFPDNGKKSFHKPFADGITQAKNELCYGTYQT